jgi:hypothetical protein
MTHVPFAREEDLCAVLAEQLGEVLVRSPSRHLTRTLVQRPVGTLIPDLIFVRAYLMPGQALMPGGLTALESAIVAALLGGRPLRDTTIARRLFSNLGRIAPRLKALERQGFVARAADGVYVLRRKVALDRTRVVAVEAKLRRWREAVRQAASYLSFANQAYVALPRPVAEGNDELLRVVLRARVGLMAVSPEQVRIVRPAPKHTPRTADRVWLLSRTIPLSA